MSWKLEKTDCSFASLSQGTKRIVTETLVEMNSEDPDEGTKRRFNDAFHHILNNGVFPRPLITMRIASGLSVLDGNHRIAAFCGLQEMPTEKFKELGLKKPAQEQEVWIGTHSRGETPLD